MNKLEKLRGKKIIRLLHTPNIWHHVEFPISSNHYGFFSFFSFTTDDGKCAVRLILFSSNLFFPAFFLFFCRYKTRNNSIFIRSHTGAFGWTLHIHRTIITMRCVGGHKSVYLIVSRAFFSVFLIFQQICCF